MSRALRIDDGDLFFHVLNRANRRVTIFGRDEDYAYFVGLIFDASVRFNMRILTFCVMPNHWHFLLYPRKGGDMPMFMKWLTAKHAQSLNSFDGVVGGGHIYQGRYKSFVVDTESYLMTVFRYIEQNPLRAGLVKRAEDWPWSALWFRTNKTDGARRIRKILSDELIQLPDDYLAWVNEREWEDGGTGLEKIRISVNKCTPYGSGDWISAIAKKYNVESTTRGVGRPRSPLN